MESILHQTLEGRVVTEAEIVHDYVQLAFGDGIGVSIFNEMLISPRPASVGTLVGKIVALVKETESRIEINFADGSRIDIDMRPIAYRGPEALVLHRQGLPTVVWN
ncbi:MAG: hypothetical protein WCK95_25945 [Alphaproteobacteria bacterium]|jgi:hypothetical protein